MKHLKIFETKTAFDADKSNLESPWVVLTEDDKNVHMMESGEPTPTYEYVDLGLPSGLKWAKCNIGATSETDYGLYFQWAATKGYTAEQVKNREKVFDFNTTPYQTNPSAGTSPSAIKFTKYLGSTTSSHKDPSATDEDALKTVLDPIDDAATQLMGKDWRMPTASEYQNLKDGTLWVWSPANTIVKVKAKDSEGKDTIIDVNYPAGYFVYKVKNDADKGKVVYEGGTIPANYSPNAHYEGEGESQVIVDGDTHIFFPASGTASGTGVNLRGSDGYYWSSSLYTSNSDLGLSLTFYSGGINPQNGNHCRYNGFCVRSVSKK